jgi:hypothetical protein
VNDTRRVSRRTLYTGVGITSAIGLGTGIVSYSHALYIARAAGNTGIIAYLVPLFADGLILLSSTALYAAAQARVERSRWATAGLIIGVAVTVVMYVAAGAANRGERATGALVAALAPLVFLVSLEVLVWLFRLGRTTPDDRPARCPHGVASSAEEAVRADWFHRRDCLGESPTYIEHGARWGIDRRRVPELVTVSVNGDGPHE